MGWPETTTAIVAVVSAAASWRAVRHTKRTADIEEDRDRRREEEDRRAQAKRLLLGARRKY